MLTAKPEKNTSSMPNRILRLLQKTAYWVIGFLILTELVYRFTPHNSGHYLKALNQKKDLLDSVKTPRLVLVGGSNVATGISSTALEREFEIPTVNIGLDERLGIDFNLNLLRYSLHPNDVVIMSFEYSSHLDPETNTRNLVDYHVPEVFQFFEKKSFLATYSEKRTMGWQEAFGQIRPDSLSDKDFSAKGDYEGKLFDVLSPKFQDISWKSKQWESVLPALLDFLSWAKRNNIQVFYTFPCYPESTFEANITEIHALEIMLQTRLPIGVLLCRPEDFVMDDTFFANGVYHLNRDGRKIRTMRLVQLLESFL
jgi:hypothetical protein